MNIPTAADGCGVKVVGAGEIRLPYFMKRVPTRVLSNKTKAYVGLHKGDVVLALDTGRVSALLRTRLTQSDTPLAGAPGIACQIRRARRLLLNALLENPSGRFNVAFYRLLFDHCRGPAKYSAWLGFYWWGERVEFSFDGLHADWGDCYNIMRRFPESHEWGEDGAHTSVSAPRLEMDLQFLSKDGYKRVEVRINDSEVRRTVATKDLMFAMSSARYDIEMGALCGDPEALYLRRGPLWIRIEQPPDRFGEVSPVQTI